MAKSVPLEYGQYYHIYNRGNNRENLFRHANNYHYFLNLFPKHITPITDIFAYCLLPNHFHLLVRIKSAEEISKRQTEPLKKPSQHFSNLFNAYTRAFNKANQRTGALFERPFGRIPVTSDAYFIQLIIYIHQNPQKHGMIDDFREWPYSSYRVIFSNKPTRLKRDTVFSWFDGPHQMERLHQKGVNEAQLEPLILEDFD